MYTFLQWYKVQHLSFGANTFYDTKIPSFDKYDRFFSPEEFQNQRSQMEKVVHLYKIFAVGWIFDWIKNYLIKENENKTTNLTWYSEPMFAIGQILIHTALDQLFATFFMSRTPKLIHIRSKTPIW